jgi:hypothetical protein
MDRLAVSLRRRRSRAAAFLPVLAAIAGLAAGWAASMQPAAAATPSGRPAPAAAALPPDFPSDVPLPPGELQGSTGGGGRWSVQLLVSGSAAAAHQSTVAFYRARGFAAETDSILHDAAHQITIVVENRDHSPNRTFVVIGVANRQPTSGSATLRSTLAGRGRGSATVVITGARVCWTFRGLHGVGHPSAATIRQGAAGHAGPVMVKLGRRYHATGCTAIPAALGQSIAGLPRGVYVSVATHAHPGGAVRGQLKRR